MWIIKGFPYKSLGTGRVALLRGKGLGLELVFAGRELGAAFEELEARLAERPGFYQGTSATINFGNSAPSSDAVTKLRGLLSEAGIELRSLSGSPEIETLAAECGLAFEATAEAPELERRRALRPRVQVSLSESARSLVADFAGARSDIAERRKRGEASVPRLELREKEAEAERPRAAPPLHVVETAPGTLYHAGTLRGGQALHHPGNIVVVGDVNPGAEIVATGDVLVFGRLAGVAHAGAQGDAEARVYAIDLAATQLRIATFIAADAQPSTGRRGPEVALVRDNRIVVVAFDQVDHLQERGS